MGRVVSRAILGVVMALMLWLSAVQAAQTGGQNALGRRIEGTWLVTGTLRDCATGEPLTGPTGMPLPPQIILNTFLAGGSMLSDPAVNPALGRTGHGVWQHVGGRNFTNKVLFFLFNPANGLHTGIVTIRRDIVLGENSDEFTTTDVAEAADLNGNVFETRCATTVGQRIQ